MLTDIVNTYLSLRRAVGFKLYTVEKCLWSYANFATARGDIRVLSTTAVEWAALASSENQRANRLKVLIRFARFARAGDSGHQSHLTISSAARAIAERRISLPMRKSNNWSCMRLVWVHSTHCGRIPIARSLAYSPRRGLGSPKRCRCALSTVVRN
jgi:hypothetical protein